jgi:TolA-binding protein
MEAIARDNDGDSVEAKDRVAELLESDDLTRAMERQQQLPGVLSTAQAPAAETVSALRDLGERMELTAVELDRLYRTILTPRVEELKQLEERASQLEQELAELETEAAITEWHQAAEELLTDLEEQNVAGGASEELRQVLREQGWGGTESVDWRWGFNAGFYTAPAAYAAKTRLLTQALQEQMQELVLVDLLSARDEATPPGYEHLVERYLKVLSSGTGNEQP